MDTRNAEASPIVLNSWEQRTLSSETLGKALSNPKTVPFTALCKWLGDISIRERF